jgi:hypothetical protein
MFWAGLEEAFKAGAKIGGAADVGFCVGFCAIKGEDGGGVGQLGQGGFGVCRVEGDVLQSALK